MALVSSYLSIITLNVKGLNSPIRRHEEAGWMKKKRANNMLPGRDKLQL